MRNTVPVIQWTSHTQHVDMETGEQLTKFATELLHYITIKTTKHVTFNANKTKGHIEYTKQCRRNPQLTIF